MGLKDKRLAFIDTETTGLDPSRHEVIDFAAVIRSADGSTERVSFKIRPEHLERADPKALEVNGYTPEGWAGAISQEEGARRMLDALNGCVIVGHNVGFDLDFIKATVTRHDKAGARKLPYHKVDTVTLAYVVLAPYGLDKLSLESVCNFLGVTNEGAHTALADVERCMAVYDRLSRASWLDRLRWGWRSRKAQ
jgi:DNA polymerase-3 subunit epsilon